MVAFSSKLRAALPMLVLASLTALPAHAQQYSFIRAFGAGAGTGSFNQPEDVAIDSTGNVFVVDSANSRIQKFDNMGTFISTFGSLGTATGQLSNTSLGLGTDGTNIFVADTNNNRIQKFDNAGNFQAAFGTPITGGTGSNAFNRPFDVAVNGSNIFVVDNGNKRIQVLTSSGVNGNTLTFQRSFGSSVNSGGSLGFPFRVAFSSVTNEVYVTDPNNGPASGGLDQIQVFNGTTGALNRVITYSDALGTLNPNGIAIDTSGNLFVTDFRNNRVIVFDSLGTPLTQFGSGGNGNGQFNGADGIAVDSTGNVFVTDLRNNRVEEFAVIAAVPETGTLLMLAGMTAGGLAAIRRKKKQTAQA